VDYITKGTKHNTAKKQTLNLRKKVVIESSLNIVMTNIAAITTKNPGPKI
jgi:hypothetical protein